MIALPFLAKSSVRWAPIRPGVEVVRRRFDFQNLVQAGYGKSDFPKVHFGGVSIRRSFGDPVLNLASLYCLPFKKSAFVIPEAIQFLTSENICSCKFISRSFVREIQQVFSGVQDGIARGDTLLGGIRCGMAKIDAVYPSAFFKV